MRLRARVPVVRWRVSPGVVVSLYVRQLVIADDEEPQATAVGFISYDLRLGQYIFDSCSARSYSQADLETIIGHLRRIGSQDDLAVIDQPIKFELEWCAECGTGFHAEECPVCGHLERVKQR